jgi:hypothetical protein
MTQLRVLDDLIKTLYKARTGGVLQTSDSRSREEERDAADEVVLAIGLLAGLQRRLPD